MSKIIFIGLLIAAIAWFFYRAEQAKKSAQKNIEVGQAFLAGNSTKEGIKTTPSGLQFEILKKGEGCYVYDNSNNKYLDYGMGLRAVILGYADKLVNRAAINQISNGNNLTRPSNIEMEVAMKLKKLFSYIDMVKFTKNSSNAVTGATKLARAYNGKKIILRCLDHPFFSFDDWFIGSTVMNKGVPKEISNLTLSFKYNDIESLKTLVKKFKNDIACIILEPSSTTCPQVNKSDSVCCGKKNCDRDFKHTEHFLKKVENICRENDIIFILDEMITGFRWHLKGAQSFYNVTPDLSTFGKAMANGFSLSAVSGKREIMELGSIEKKGAERVFLLSSTHGGEMTGMAAFMATLNKLKNEKIIEKNWDYGIKLKNVFNNIAKDMNINDYIYMTGVGCSPYYVCLDKFKKPSQIFKTLFVQQMLKSNILMPWVAISYSHGKKELEKTRKALIKTFEVYKKALKLGPNKFVQGRIIKPVFRKYN